MKSALLLSVLLSLAVLLPSVLLLVNSSYWHNLHSALEGWLERHPWDRKVLHQNIQPIELIK